MNSSKISKFHVTRTKPKFEQSRGVSQLHFTPYQYENKQTEMSGTHYNNEFRRFNDMRGWNTCDICGRFTSPSAKGVSTYFVPDSDRTYEDFGLRCSGCTKKYGEIPPSQGCVQKYCSSTNK